MASFYGTDPGNSGAAPAGGGSYGGLGNYIDPATGDSLTNSAYYGQNPGAAYYTWLNQQGLGGQSNISQYAQGQQNRYYGQYLSWLPTAPAGNNTFLNYLQGSSLNPGQEYSTLGARAQGQQPFMYSPRARWSVPT